MFMPCSVSTREPPGSLDTGGVMMRRIRAIIAAGYQYVTKSGVFYALRAARAALAAGYQYITKSGVFYVKGRYLYDNERRKVILRGINLPLLDDWAFPGNDKLGELAKTGANAVRIQWYAQYPNPQRPPYKIEDL